MGDTGEVYWNKMVPELTVTDFFVSLSFYTSVLGFTVMIRRTNPDFAYICLGEAQIMIEQYHPKGWNTSDLVKPLGRGVNFQIEVDDITQIFKRVIESGITLYRDLNNNYYDIGEKNACQREFLVQDPDGYLLRFSQYIE